MSETLHKIKALTRRGEVRLSFHGYEQLAEDDILVRDVIDGLDEAVVIEDYPNYAKGPCVLVLQRDSSGRGIHAVWGIGQQTLGPAVLITAYRPDPLKWSADFLRRIR